ncbi:MAG: hypothetical protein ABL993_00855 [Vicinamibacterales bacterium]
MPDGEGGVTAFGVRSHDGASQVQHLLFHHAGGASAGAVEIETTATEPSAGVVGADKLLFTADGYIDLITGTVTAFSPTTGGLVVPLAEGGVTEIELPVSDPVQVAFGGWAGMANGAAAVFQGLELNEFPLTFRLGLGNAQRQQAPVATYKTLDAAAFRGMSYTWQKTWEFGWEFGGQICRMNSGGYYPSGPVTNRTSGEINIPSFLTTHCLENTTTIGRYHTHTMVDQPFPSGAQFTGVSADIETANSNPDLTFYVMTKPLRATDVGAICPATGCVATVVAYPTRSVYRYHSTNGVDAIDHMELRVNGLGADGQWVHFPRQW